MFAVSLDDLLAQGLDAEPEDYAGRPQDWHGPPIMGRTRAQLVAHSVELETLLAQQVTRARRTPLAQPGYAGLVAQAQTTHQDLVFIDRVLNPGGPPRLPLRFT